MLFFSIVSTFKKNPLHLQVNVMYAFKKYRVFSLCGLSVGVCVCARVFQGSSVLKCEKVYTPIANSHLIPSLDFRLHLFVLWFALVSKLQI